MTILRRRTKKLRVTAPQREEAARVLVTCRLVSCRDPISQVVQGWQSQCMGSVRAYRRPGIALATGERGAQSSVTVIILLRCDRYRGALREGYLTVVSAAPSTPGEREIRSRSWGPAPVLFIEERRIERKRHIHAT